MILVGSKVDIKEIGKREFDTKELFSHMRNLNTVFCWGSHNWAFYQNKWLRFNVQGYLFKGHVYITLNWDDTFTIYFTTSHGTIKGIKENIYVDTLIDTIDSFVETK
jgi:hypothetical protein